MLKVILEVGKIPDGATVTKINGAKLYHLHHKLNLRHESGDKQSIDFEGVSFLIQDTPSGASNILCISDTKEVIWHVENDEFANYLDEIEDWMKL